MNRKRWFGSFAMVALLLMVTLWSCGGGEITTAPDQTCREGEVLGDSICVNDDWQPGYQGPCQGVSCSNHGACFDEGGAARCECDAGYEASGLDCVAIQTGGGTNSGNGGGEDPDPCDGVTCSDHGTCFVGGDGQGHCDCDSGFEAVGTQCLEQHPCEGITCGEHGSCTVSGGDPVCDCDTGYAAEPGDLFCSEEDEPHPCEGETCSGHGECLVDAQGSPRCVCDQDYEPDGLSCVYQPPPDPCEGVTCSGQGTCVASGGSASCNCNSGYQAQGLNCVPEDDPDPCAGVNSCGPNGSCFDSGGSPACNCNAGYEPEGLSCVAVPQCTGISGDCAVHILSFGSSSYQVTNYINTDLGEELDGPIVAAFGLEDTNRGYVLTASRYYRINTSNFSVLKSGPLSEIHSVLGSGPALSGVTVVPERHPGGAIGSGNGNDQIGFFRNASNANHGEVFYLDYDFNSGTFSELDGGSSWISIQGWTQTINAEYVPSISDVTLGMWLDDKNSRGFMSDGVADYCEDENLCCLGDDITTGEGLPYSGMITGNAVHYNAATHCHPFTERQPVASAEIFSFANSPFYGDVGGVIWHNRTLMIFTAGYYQ